MSRFDENDIKKTVGQTEFTENVSEMNEVQKEYAVIKQIAEDDYGCEERDENAPLMALCYTVSIDGQFQDWIRIPESVLKENGLDEGSKVTKEFIEKYN